MELEKYNIFMDGASWCATYHNFVNLQESPAGFGDTQELAVINLLESELQRAESRLKEAEAREAVMVEALKFAQIKIIELAGENPHVSVVPKIAQAISLASPRAKQILAVVEAAKEISAKMRLDCPRLICEAVRNLK